MLELSLRPRHCIPSPFPVRRCPRWTVRRNLCKSIPWARTFTIPQSASVPCSAKSYPLRPL